MKKGATWIVILGVICAILGIIGRLKIEKADNTVLLVLDGEALWEYAKSHDYQVENLLPDLSFSQIKALAVPETKIWQAASKKEITVIPGSYLLLSEIRNLPPIDPRKLYINEIVSGPISKRMKLMGESFAYQDSLIWEFSSEYEVPTTRRKEATREPTISLWEEAIYPNYKMIETLKASDYSIVARIQNPYVNNKDVIEYVINQWPSDSNLVIFQGKEVLGYPQHLKEAADLLEGKTWGFIEFANQYGEKELARLTDYNLVRVHSITPKEMERIDPQKAHERYLRAVRERGARVLYLRPFEFLSWEENLVRISILKDGLEEEGFQLGEPKPKPFFKSSFWLFWPVLLGIVVCGIELMHLLGFKNRSSVYTAFVALVAITILYLKGYTVLARQVSAFGAAVVFPTLAIGKVAEGLKNGRKNLGYLVLTVLGYTFVGVLFLTASLLDLRFVIKVEQFLGVKLMHILPPILSLWICIRYLGVGWSKEKFFGFFWPLRWSHVLLFVFVILIGFIYIGRTGHDWGLPVPQIEEDLRVYLEKVFLIRPRLKEAFIGHPVLFLALFLGAFSASIWYLPYLLAIGSIGVTSVLNTFSHAHTPFMVSLIRTFWGLLIGGLIGTLLYLLLKFTSRKIGHG